MVTSFVMDTLPLGNGLETPEFPAQNGNTVHNEIGSKQGLEFFSFVPNFLSTTEEKISMSFERMPTIFHEKQG